MPTAAQNPLASSVAAVFAQNKQTQALARFREIADYCRAHENGRVLRNFIEQDMLEVLIAYHEAKGTLTVLRLPDGAICGVHMWYRCNSDWEFDDVVRWTPDDMEGDAIFMAFLYASERGALKEMVYDFLQKEPDALVKRLITSRFKGGSQQRIDRDVRYLHKILKQNERLCYG